MTNKTNLDGVVVTYHQVVPEDQQMPEWYVDGTTCTDVATLEYKGRTLHLARNGEMYIAIPVEEWEDDTKLYSEHITRYSDDLERIASNDKELMDLLHLWSVEREYEIYHMNPWWELYSDDLYPDGMVCESDFYGAIDEAIDFIKDDTNWEEPNE
jgi:hypothetical protein